MAVGWEFERMKVKQMTEIHFDIETKSSVDLAMQWITEKYKPLIWHMTRQFRHF